MFVLKENVENENTRQASRDRLGGLMERRTAIIIWHSQGVWYKKKKKSMEGDVPSHQERLERGTQGAGPLGSSWDKAW